MGLSIEVDVDRFSFIGKLSSSSLSKSKLNGLIVMGSLHRDFPT